MKVAGKVLLAVFCVSLVFGAGTVLAQDVDAKKADVKKADQYCKEAKELYGKGQYKQAQAKLVLALNADPDHAQAKALLAAVRAKLKLDPKTREFIDQIRADKRALRDYQRRLADHYFETAQKRFGERLYQEAEQNLHSALEANPQHKKAKELLARVRVILRKDDSGSGNLIDDEAMKKNVWRSYALAEMRKTIVDARKLVKEQEFDEALDKLRNARNSAKVLASHLDVSREKVEIKSLTQQAEEEREKQTKADEREKLEAARRIAEAGRAHEAELRKERITRMFRDAKDRFEETRYIVAAKKAEEILKLDPRNKEVGSFLDKCHQMQVTKREKWYARAKLTETEKTWREVAVLSIPYTQPDPLYPDNWEEIRKRRAGTAITGESTEEEEWRKKLEAKLEEPVSFDFIATPLDDVVAFLRNLKKVNIVVDKKAKEGRENDLDITLRLDKVRFKDALNWVLRLVELKYTLDNQVIYISTEKRIKQTKKTVTRYYDVSDLTVELRHFKPNLRAITNEVDDPEEMEDIFGEDEEEDDDTPDTFTGDSLVEFIKSVIAPGTWDDVAADDDGGL